MKKLVIATFMMVAFAGASFAQNSPARTKAHKMNNKKSDSTATDTTTHHMHKGTKHTKA